MRSGYFDKGKQIGEWTTCDTKGKVYKVTKRNRKKSPEKSGDNKSLNCINQILIIVLEGHRLYAM
jgi:hypothetical protein